MLIHIYVAYVAGNCVSVPCFMKEALHSLKVFYQLLSHGQAFITNRFFLINS